MFNEATALTFPAPVPTPVYRAVIDKRVEVFGNCCPPIPWTQFVTRPFTLTDRQIQNEIERERVGVGVEGSVGNSDWVTNTCDQQPESPIEYHRNRNTTYVQKFVRLIKFDSAVATGTAQGCDSGQKEVGLEWVEQWPRSRSVTSGKCHKCKPTQKTIRRQFKTIFTAGNRSPGSCYLLWPTAQTRLEQQPAERQRAGNWNSCSNFCSISFDLVIWH